MTRSKKAKKALKAEAKKESSPPVVKTDVAVATPKTVKLFVYDMLNTHHVQRTIWGEAKTGAPHTLDDYELKAYANGTFYVEKKLGERVSGKLYEITEDQLKDTSWYETEAYEHQIVNQGGVLFGFYKKVKEVK